MVLTDKKAIRIALELAIDTEESLIDAYTGPYTGKVAEDEPGVVIARKNIAAFKRVLDRYYGGYRTKAIDAGKTVSIYELMAKTEPAEGG